MREVVIVSAARTALGSFGGSLASVPAVELGAVAIRAALSRGGVDAGMVEEVVMGNVLQAGLARTPRVRPPSRPVSPWRSRRGR